MMNKKFLHQIIRQHNLYHKQKEEVKRKSARALSKSKQAIFALHHQEIKKACKLIQETERIFRGLAKDFKKKKELSYEGAYKASLEEYVEAKMFYHLLRNQKINFIKKINIEPDIYLGGLSDLTGEIVRKMIDLTTQYQFGQAEKLKNINDEIMKELAGLTYLNGYLRQKYDAAKRNLKKAEEILYEIKMKNKREIK